MIQINNLVKNYVNKPRTLNGINLNIEQGDLFAFIGHNGAGKTTLIKCLTGILNFEEGSISIFGKDIVKESIEAKRLMAYVPDNPDVYKFMTGIEFIHFILTVYNIEIESKKDEIMELAEKYEMVDDLNKKIGEYSHGMQQKIVLITAFIRNAKLLVLDEPFVGLDPKASKITREMMKDFCEEGGIVFFSTHVLETAQLFCNKVAIIKKGNIISHGKMEELIQGKSLEDLFFEEV